MYERRSFKHVSWASSRFNVKRCAVKGRWGCSFLGPLGCIPESCSCGIQFWLSPFVTYIIIYIYNCTYCLKTFMIPLVGIAREIRICIEAQILNRWYWTTKIILCHTFVKEYKSPSYLRHGGCRLLNIHACLCDEAKLKQSKSRWRDDLFNSSLIGIYYWISLKGWVNEVHDFELPLLLQLYTNEKVLLTTSSSPAFLMCTKVK